MSRPTYPRIFFDNTSGRYRAEMIDKKTGRIWGQGYGKTRQEAIMASAVDQPPASTIKKAMGLVTRHPFVAGAAVGTYLEYRRARYHPEDIRVANFISAAVIAGAMVWGACWLLGKIFRSSSA